jgi:hypothetical protein
MKIKHLLLALLILLPGALAFETVGTCIISDNVSVCNIPLDIPVAQPDVNINLTCPPCPNVTYNLTCPIYNLSTVIDNMYAYTQSLDNATDDLQDSFVNITLEMMAVVDTFNLTKEYADVYANWKGCTESFSKCYNESLKYDDFDLKYSNLNSRFNECSRSLVGCKTNLNITMTESDKLESERWTYALFGAVAGFGLCSLMLKKEFPKPSHLGEVQDKTHTPLHFTKEGIKKFKDLAKGD